MFVSVELFKIRKYAKTRNVLKIFESGSYTLGHGKLEKVMEIVMKVVEFGDLKRV